MHHHTPPANRAALRLPALLALAAMAALAGCSTPAPQGYGVTESAAQQAQQQLEKAEQSTQADPRQTYLNLITQMQQANQWYASLAHTEAFERQYGSSAQIRLLRADALRNTGQGQQAEQAYQALLAEPDDHIVARAQRGLGLLYASQGHLAQAVAQLEQARQRNPIDADVLSDLAYAHMLGGQLEPAQLPILQAAQLAPANARVQLNLALYWLASGNQAQATQLLRRLSQPQAKNTPALIDEQSLHTLQAQRQAVEQAVRARAESSAPAIAPLAATPPLTGMQSAANAPTADQTQPLAPAQPAPPPVALPDAAADASANAPAAEPSATTHGEAAVRTPANPS